MRPQPPRALKSGRIGGRKIGTKLPSSSLRVRPTIGINLKKLTQRCEVPAGAPHIAHWASHGFRVDGRHNRKWSSCSCCPQLDHNQARLHLRHPTTRTAKQSELTLRPRGARSIQVRALPSHGVVTQREERSERDVACDGSPELLVVVSCSDAGCIPLFLMAAAALGETKNRTRPTTDNDCSRLWRSSAPSFGALWRHCNSLGKC